MDLANLKAALTVVKKVAPTKTTIPIIANVLLDGKVVQGLRLTATDLDTYLTVTLDGEGAGGVYTLVPAALLAKVLGSLDAGEGKKKKAKADVTLVAAERKLSLTAGGRTLKLQDGGAPEEFPAWPAFGDGAGALLFDPEKLEGALAWTLLASGRDKTRSILEGLQLDLQEGRLTATDGHRLHQAPAGVQMNTSGAARNDDGSAVEYPIIPNGSAEALLTAIKTFKPKTVEARLWLNKPTDKPTDKEPVNERFYAYLAFKLAAPGVDVEITARLINDAGVVYPDWRQIMPAAKAKDCFTVPTEPLRRALKLAKDLGADGVTLATAGSALSVESSDPDAGTAQEEIQLMGLAPKRRVHVSAAYLTDALSDAKAAEVLLQLNEDESLGGSASIVLIRYADQAALVMPMRD